MWESLLSVHVFHGSLGIELRIGVSRSRRIVWTGSSQGCGAMKVYPLYLERFVLDRNTFRVDKREEAELRRVGVANEVAQMGKQDSIRKEALRRGRYGGSVGSQ